jgi:hypothetical protein
MSVTSRTAPQHHDSTAGPVATPDALRGLRGPRARHVAALVALLLSWLVPLGAGALGVEWILPIVLLLGTASLLRAGRTALDRLVLATGLLIGATAAAGLVLSVWPWHLSPVPVAGTAFSGLVVVGWALRRRPLFPRAFGLADAIVVGLTVLASAVPLVTLRHTASAWRLGMLAYGDDFARHYLLYDAIRVGGGYVYLHRDATPFVPDDLQAYPQGSHLLYALLENFLTGSTVPNAPMASLNHLVVFLIGSYVFFMLSVLWAVRWIAGRWLAGWAALPVLGAVGTYLALGDPMGLVPDGYVSLVPGLSLVVLVGALLARSARPIREQMVLVASLVVGISFVYYLALPIVIVGGLAWLFVYRRQLRRHAWTLVITLVATAVLALVTPVTNSRANTGAQLLLPGGGGRQVRWLVVTIVAVPLLALLVRRVRRVMVWRLAAFQVAVAAGTASAIWLYQKVRLGHAIYYFEKSLLQMTVLGLIGAGVLGAVALSALRGGSFRPQLVRARVTAGVGFLACVIFAAGTYFSPGLYFDVSKGTAYARDYWATPYVGDAVAQTLRRYPNSDGYIDLVLFTPGDADPNSVWGRKEQSWATLYVGTLQRNYVPTAKAYAWLYPYDGIVSAEWLAQRLRENGVRGRVITDQPKLLAEFRALEALNPGLLVVVDSREWWQKPVV